MIDRDLGNWYHMVSKTPELARGQAAGRPDWQIGLPIDVLARIDSMANKIGISNARLAEYISFTEPYRRNARANNKDGKE